MSTGMSIRETIKAKQLILENAARTLRQSFFGIDSIIDQVIEAVSSWFLFPNIQQRPVIVNLWGLTGVGKSALVKELSCLLGFERKFYRFDLGEKSTNDYVVKRHLREIYNRENGFPIILSFDEFQHARTIDEKGTENEQVVSRIVWEILDSGKFQSLSTGTWISDVYELILRLGGLLRNGVQGNSGKVTEGLDVYEKEFGSVLNQVETAALSQKREATLVPDFYLEQIFWVGRELFEFPQDVRNTLDMLNGPETMQFLKRVMEVGESPKTVDCSKALIFVVGNLDEAYGMGSSMNPDIDADILHEESLKITLSDVKRVLTKRFRYEQIARLGNVHIVYPALDKATYRRIIELELESIAERLHATVNLHVRFDSSVVDLIYQEGVFPTQGARPIFTSINQLIASKIGGLICKITESNQSTDTFLVTAKEEVLRISSLDKTIESIIGEEKVARPLNALRQTKPDDLQAIVAVHESGHAVVAMALRGIVPTCIFSRTADLSVRGFVHFRDDEDFVSRKQMIHRVAERLAGFAAEELIYGKENVTNGSANDLHVATEYLSHLVRDCGMGNMKGQFMPPQLETAKYLFDKNGKVEANMLSILEEGFIVAREILVRENRLLVNLSIALTEKNKLNSIKIKNMVFQYGTTFLKSEVVERKGEFGYRQYLYTLKNNGEIIGAEDSGFDGKPFPISLNSAKG